jgi:hypothetical protein
MIAYFDRYIRNCAIHACSDWGYPDPHDDYFIKMYRRLPEGLRYLLGTGVKRGLIIPKGRSFSLKGLSSDKGPYNWFSRSAETTEPAPNWEYYVQVAEYIRLYPIAKSKNLILKFEDDLMDLALYKDKKVLVCIEVKERATQLEKLIAEIKSYRQQIDYKVNDRGNDALRKAKYIDKQRPEYFCGVAIGAKHEYRVSYPDGHAFELTKDQIPYV